MADKDILRMQEICSIVLRPGINDSIGVNSLFNQNIVFTNYKCQRSGLKFL